MEADPKTRGTNAREAGRTTPSRQRPSRAACPLGGAAQLARPPVSRFAAPRRRADGAPVVRDLRPRDQTPTPIDPQPFEFVSNAGVFFGGWLSLHEKPRRTRRAARLHSWSPDAPSVISICAHTRSLQPRRAGSRWGLPWTVPQCQPRLVVAPIVGVDSSKLPAIRFIISCASSEGGAAGWPSLQFGPPFSTNAPNFPIAGTLRAVALVDFREPGAPLLRDGQELEHGARARLGENRSFPSDRGGALEVPGR